MSCANFRNRKGSATLAGLFIAMVSLLAVTCVSAALLRTASRLKQEGIELRNIADAREEAAYALAAYDMSGNATAEPLNFSGPPLSLIRGDPGSPVAAIVAANSGKRRPSWKLLRSSVLPEFRCRWAAASSRKSGPAAAAAAKTCALEDTQVETSIFIPGNAEVHGSLTARSNEPITIAVMGDLNLTGALVLDEALDFEIVAAGDILLPSVSLPLAARARVRISSITGTIRFSEPPPIAGCLEPGPKLRLEAGRDIKVALTSIGSEAGCDFPYAPRHWPNLKAAGEKWTADDGSR